MPKQEKSNEARGHQLLGKCLLHGEGAGDEDPVIFIGYSKIQYQKFNQKEG